MLGVEDVPRRPKPLRTVKRWVVEGAAWCHKNSALSLGRVSRVARPRPIEGGTGFRQLLGASRVSRGLWSVACWMCCWRCACCLGNAVNVGSQKRPVLLMPARTRPRVTAEPVNGSGRPPTRTPRWLHDGEVHTTEERSCLGRNFAANGVNGGGGPGGPCHADSTGVLAQCN